MVKTGTKKFQRSTDEMQKMRMDGELVAERKERETKEARDREIYEQIQMSKTKSTLKAARTRREPHRKVGKSKIDFGELHNISRDLWNRT